MKRKKILIGSRASKLALIYANKAKNQISEHFSGELSCLLYTSDAADE